MSEKNNTHKLGRRDFIKASGSTLALSFLGSKLVKSASPLSINGKVQASGDDWVYGYCRMCMAPQCGIRAKIKYGTVVLVEGNPDHPYNQGALCPRGNASIMNLYNPYRVKAPMKRTNPERGPDVDPGWVEITWDEALETVAAELKKIKDEDPRGLVYLTGFGAFPDNSPVSWTVFPVQFGTPNSIHTNGPMCPVHYSVMSTQGTFTDRVDLEYCEMLVTIGSSVGANWCDAGNAVRELANARDRGMRMVAVDPRCWTEASMDQWVPILPGTELALVLALQNVILYEIEKYDVWFLKTRTNGIYLTLEEGGYARDLETGKPLVWDLADSQAKVFDDPNLSDPALEGSFTVNGTATKTAFTVLKENVNDATPEWAEEISTVPADVIRSLAAELVEKARIGATIEIDGFKFPYSPVAVWAKRGTVAKRGGNYVQYGAKNLNALLGALDVPGAMQGDFAGPVLAPGADGTIVPNQRLVPQAEEWIGIEWSYPPEHLNMGEFYPNKHSLPHIAWRALLNPEKYHLEYEIKGMVIHGSNPIINCANMSEPVEAFKKVPFIVSIAYHFDEPTQFADIVLPEHSNMERVAYYDVTTDGKSCSNETRGLTGINVRTPFVPPIYNSRQAEDIIFELAERMGMLPGVNGMLSGMLRLGDTYKLKPMQRYQWRDIINRMLIAKYGQEHDLDSFKETGFLIESKPLKQTYNYFYFPGSATRIPIYSEHMWAAGEQLRANLDSVGIEVPGWEGKMDEYFDFYRPVPHWVVSHLLKAPAEYDLSVINWKIPFLLFGLGGTIDNPWAQEIIRTFDPYIHVFCMHPETAAEKGIAEGDMIEATSQHGGKVKGKVVFTELVHPKIVGVAGNFGRVSVGLNPIAQGGVNYNQLLGTSEDTIDPVIGALDNSARIKVERI